MFLFLFAISFTHFGEGHLEQAWANELAFHHAGIPLALYVLMQEYRFVWIDAFIRLLANGLLAGVFGLLIVTQLRTQPIALQVLIAALSVAVYAWSRDALQALLTRVVFRRSSPHRLESALESLRAHHDDEAEYLRAAAQTIATLMAAPIVESPHAPADGLLFPTRTDDFRDLQRQGVRVIVPIRLSLGDTRYVLLGDRPGGRLYLSEDLEALARLAATVAEQVERIRTAETARLVAQAELRALQAQIHPHFLFNALNTLYGIIPREAHAARKTVLNLADIFRYFLRSDKAFVPLEEEMSIVNAYLAIEAQRLGPRLRLEIHVDPTLLREPIPVLSIEPLVENAIKHGVAARTEGGTVRIGIEREGEAMIVSIFDDGPGFASKRPTSGAGVGLENVNRRLQLSYGPSSEVKIERLPHGTRVSFRAPRSLQPEPRAIASRASS
jgi:hypothetical protein